MLKEFFDAIFARGFESAKREAQVLHDDGLEKTYLLDGGANAPQTLKSFKLLHPEYREHSFLTVDGLCDYLSSRHCQNDSGILFVGETRIFGNLQYTRAGKHTVSMSLDPSEAFESFQTLLEPTHHKAFWKALGTALHGCFPEELLMQVASLSFNEKTQGDIQIDNSGLGRRQISTTQKIFVPAENSSVEFQTNWTFDAPIYACDPQAKQQIPVRIEAFISDAKLYFSIQPIGLPTILNQARIALIERIKTSIPGERFTIHEGNY